MLVQTSADDINKVQKNIEAWYDSTMDRVSGWYKRRVQTITLIVGLILTVVANTDTIAIFKSLSTDPALRNAMVMAAQEYSKTKISTDIHGKPEERLKRNLDELEKLSLPIGWGANSLAIPTTPGDWFLKVLRWCITVMAISLGAPFWFDVLNKFMVVRATVKPTEKSPEEASEDRQRKG